MGTDFNCVCLGKDTNIGNVPVDSLTNPPSTKNNQHLSLNGKRRDVRIRSISMPKNYEHKASGETILNQINVHKSPSLSNLSQIQETHELALTVNQIDNGIPNDENKVVTNNNNKTTQDEESLPNEPVVESMICVEHVITQDEENHIRKALNNHFVFKDINQEVLSMVFNELIYFSFEKNKVIYEEGDNGNYFYIIAEGKVESTEKTKPLKRYSQWECFGELSLIAQCKREETVKTLSKVSVFSLDGESFREIQKKINEARLKERFNFINKISIFEHLDQISKYNVAEKIKMKEFAPMEKIITKGEIGDTLFIIKDGIVSCKNGFKEVRRLSTNDYFGQNAILIDAKRSIDVFALQRTICYELSRNDLIEALGNNYIDIILYGFFRHCIEGNNYFKDIVIESLMEEVFKCFTIRTYVKNEKIVNTKSKSNKRVIVVIEGSLYTEKPFDLVADKSIILGDYIFKDYSKDLPSDVIAYPDCIAFEADVDALAAKMKIDLSNMKLNLLNRISKLKKLSLFKHLSDCTLEKIAAGMKKYQYNNNDVIVEEGTTGDTFYLITKGRVRVTSKGKILRDLETGNSFGEIALLADEEKRTATVTAIDKAICYVIYKKDFDLIFDDKTIKDYLLKKLSLQDTSIELSDLHYIRFLGKGKFGNVSLVHNKKNIYAIKAVSRRSVDKQKILAKYFVNERRVMQSLDHPFVVKMVKSMKNQHFCFFLIEYVNGKNLDEYLTTRVNKRNIPETQFYLGSMFLMLDYLQKKYIAHRDIKPSNIMIDENGYLKMIDFGTAKVLSDYTSTIIGTPHYIAPEILQGKGYSLSCDFWSVGICMYEIFYGMYPFGQYANDANEIYKDVIYKDFVFPSDNDKYCYVNCLIQELLEKKVNRRICNSSLLKSRPFFHDFEWDKLIEFHMKPPYIPNTSDMMQYLNTENPYDAMVSEDTYVPTKKDRERDDNIPLGYDRAWADEF